MSLRPQRSRYDLTRDEIATFLGDEEPTYRLDQLWRGLYVDLAEPGDISTLPAGLRERLSNHQEFGSALHVLRRVEADHGETIKWLYQLRDGNAIESVVMYSEDDRVTVCVSSQAGCAMGCTFCATGQRGFARHLGSGEIVEQVIAAQREVRMRERSLTNIVFMGMGEPLANTVAVFDAIRRIHDDLGIGARRITVSTVGVIPGIRKLIDFALPVNLAVSLHAANDETRSQLVPLNVRYPLKELIGVCHDYSAATHRRVSFEWALIDDVNDRASDAAELAQIAQPLGAHVNLIPLNPTPGYPVRGSSRNRVHQFAKMLTGQGVNVTIRDTRGSDIDAACGQLAFRAESQTDF